MKATRKKATSKGTAVPVRFYDPERDGVTFGLLSTFTDCREKARLSLEGWSGSGTTLAITFGNIVHYILMLVYTDLRNGKLTGLPGPKYTARLLEQVERVWRADNPLATADTVQHFEFTMAVCSGMMPLYFKYWYADDFKKIEWKNLETVFRLPMTVTDLRGRQFQTFLRGKMDGVFAYPGGALRLFETKTKSRIDYDTLIEILAYDRQVSVYVTALLMQGNGKHPAGVVYNIVRRTALRQRSSETWQQFSERVVKDIELNPDWYFSRIQIKLDEKDLTAMRREVDALVTDFILWRNGEAPHYRNTNHCENKYGTCQFIKVCGSGDYTGLVKRQHVFPELEDI